MAFPQYFEKHLEESLVQPEQSVKYGKHDRKKFPKKYIIVYHESAAKKFIQKYKPKKIPIFSKHYVLKKNDVGLIHLKGIGAPHAGVFFETLIALGGKEFINLGFAGGLYSDGIFLCEKAIRDEGTSHHYLPQGKYSFPDKTLTRRLETHFKRNKITYEIGTTWTIDAPFRETKKEVEHYSMKGVKTVEMEASALFAIGKLRKVKVASAFVVSDVLGKKWSPKFGSNKIKNTLSKMIDCAYQTLSTKHL